MTRLTAALVAECERAVVGDRLARIDLHADVGPDGQRRAGGHRERRGKNVKQVCGVDADQVQVDVAAGLRATVDLDIIEAGVTAQVLNVAIRQVERGVESVAGEVATIEDAAVVEVDLAEVEGTATGDQMPTRIDGNFGEVASATGEGREWRIEQAIDLKRGRFGAAAISSGRGSWCRRSRASSCRRR